MQTTLPESSERVTSVVVALTSRRPKDVSFVTNPVVVTFGRLKGKNRIILFKKCVSQDLLLLLLLCGKNLFEPSPSVKSGLWQRSSPLKFDQNFKKSKNIPLLWIHSLEISKHFGNNFSRFSFFIFRNLEIIWAIKQIHYFKVKVK